MNFTEKQEAQLDEIYDAAYNLLCVLARKNKSTEPIIYDWDMSQIGELVDAAADILKKNGYDAYYPAIIINDNEEHIEDFD